MLSRPSLHRLLLCMLRQLLPALIAVLGARTAELRVRLAALPAGHRRRARMLGELRRLARWRVLLAEPELLDDPAFRGKAAEVARVRNDAGRRALVRRLVHPPRYGLLRRDRPGPRYAWITPGGRCSCWMGIA